MDYKVHKAICVATAIMNYEVFEEIEHFMLDNISFKQADIKNEP